MDTTSIIVTAVLLCAFWVEAVMPGRAVRLCVPDDKSNEILQLSDEGLDVLRSIGEDPVVVIAITGPARTGKSYFLSKLSDTASFEVGHGLEGQTVGLWISKDVLLERNNVKARLVLIDAEGSGSITRDKGSIDRWDASVVSLCTMLSSVLIYNSNKIPSYSDLQKLHFFSMFSETGSYTHDEKATEALVWLIRDNTIDLAETGYNDWTSFFENKVFRNKENTARGNILSGIRSVFPKFRAIALPPPSLDPRVCKNLDAARHREKISPFPDALNSAVKDIVSLAQVKRISGKPMTGKECADLIGKWVNELNEKGGKFTWESMYEMKIKYVCITQLDECKEQVKYETNRIAITCDENNVLGKLNDIRKSTMAKLSSTCEQSEYLAKLESFINNEKSDLLDRWGKVQYDCLLKHFNHEISVIDLFDMDTNCRTVISTIDNIEQGIQKKINELTPPEVKDRIDIGGLTTKMEEKKHRILNKWFVSHVGNFMDNYKHRLRSRINIREETERTGAEGYIREIEREELGHFRTDDYDFPELNGYQKSIELEMTNCRHELVNEWMELLERIAWRKKVERTTLLIVGAAVGGTVGFMTSGPIGAAGGAAAGAAIAETMAD